MNKADVDSKTLDGYKKATISTKNLADYTSHLMGKLLTIVDASVSSPTQSRAMKDLIVSTLWTTTDKVTDWMVDQQGDKGSTFPY